MPFAIYRTEKLKSPAAISASAAHNSRSRVTHNADAARTPRNRQIFGFDGGIPLPRDLLGEWEKRVRHARRKPDAVLMQELFLGCSPEFFTDLPPNITCDEQVERWSQRCVQWLREEFGENLLSATLHLDETTPHVAAYVVPLMPAKDGSIWLSGKKLFNPLTLTQQQDRYAASVGDLGLERGVRGSTAEHRSIRAFYGAIQKAAKDDVVASASDRISSFRPPQRHALEPTTSYVERVAAEANVRIRASEARAEELRPLAAETVAAKKAEKQQRKTNQILSMELSESRANLKELTDLVRDIPLSDVLSRLGWGEGVREGASWVWRTGDHVIVVTGSKWFDHKAGKGGGKSIDLVMHLMSCSFVDAVGWLAGQWTIQQASAAIRVAAPQLANAAPKKSFSDLWNYFAKPDPRATNLVRDYLVSVRGLDPDLVEDQIRAELLHGSFQRQRYGGPRPWCVFRHLDERGETMGATLRALDEEAQPKRSIGDKTTAFFAVGPAILDADELAIVESPVDALSYLQRSRRARVVSVAGSVVPEVLFKSARAHRLPISVALDNDAAGERGWQVVMARVREWGADLVARLRRVVPRLAGWETKDWNDVLRAETVERNAAPSSSQRVRGNDAPLPAVMKPIRPPSPRIG